MITEQTGIYTNPKLYVEAIRRLGVLPGSVIAGDRIFLPPDTNVFINDTDNDSFPFLMALLPRSIPFIQQFGEPPLRGVEIWEADYLTEKLADTLITGVDDLSARVLIPMTGCGGDTARRLARRLNECRVDLEIVHPEDVGARSAIIVDDVLKTGGTIARELPESLLKNPDNLFAVWAMPALTKKDYSIEERYSPLRYITNQGQRIFAGVVYAGSGLSSPGLGLPVNSISTLLADADKAAMVVKSLANKYFGKGIYRATEQ